MAASASKYGMWQNSIGIRRIATVKALNMAAVIGARRGGSA